MKILNPLYDNAFKYLMESDNIAKLVLSIILDTEILTLDALPQETTFYKGELQLFRFDYKAVIKDENNETKTVLVEVQKYNSPNPISRFRNYLASNYARHETIKTKDGETTKMLPLVAIYILGFGFSNLDNRAVKVLPQVVDMMTNEVIEVKNNFIDLLNHKSYILVAKDNQKVKTGHSILLEQLIKLFIQKFTGETANIVIDIDEEQFQSELLPIIERLKLATLNGELLRKVQMEQDYIDEEISKEQLLAESLEREKEERKLKEEAKQREEKAKQKLAKKMIKYGEAIEEIIAETGLSAEEIKQLKNAD